MLHMHLDRCSSNIKMNKISSAGRWASTKKSKGVGEEEGKEGKEGKEELPHN